MFKYLDISSFYVCFILHICIQEWTNFNKTFFFFETALPQLAFVDLYLLSRKFDLAPEQKTFIFRMIQSFYQQETYFPSPACTFCSAPEDNSAYLLTFTQSSAVTSHFLRCLSEHSKECSAAQHSIIRVCKATWW
jgi:hypothetical protein